MSVMAGEAGGREERTNETVCRREEKRMEESTGAGVMACWPEPGISSASMDSSD